MPDHLGDDMRKTKNEDVKEEKDIKGWCADSVVLSLSDYLFLLCITALDERDIEILKTYVSHQKLFPLLNRKIMFDNLIFVSNIKCNK